MRVSIIALAFLLSGCFGESPEVKESIETLSTFKESIQKQIDLIDEHQSIIEDARNLVEMTVDSNVEWDSVVDFCMENNVPSCKEIRELIE